MNKIFLMGILACIFFTGCSDCAKHRNTKESETEYVYKIILYHNDGKVFKEYVVESDWNFTTGTNYIRLYDKSINRDIMWNGLYLTEKVKKNENF